MASFQFEKQKYDSHVYKNYLFPWNYKTIVKIKNDSNVTFTSKETEI